MASQVSSISSEELRGLFENEINGQFSGPYRGNGSHRTVRRAISDVFKEYWLSFENAMRLCDRFSSKLRKLHTAPLGSGRYLQDGAYASANKALQAVRRALNLRLSPKSNGEIFKETLSAVKHFAHAKARLIPAILVPLPDPNPVCSTVFETLNLSTFKTARKLVGEGFNPLVLDMANAYSVGGAPERANAQEETLCRQSTLYPALLKISGGQKNYDPATSGVFLSGGGIYVRKALFIRNDAEDGCAFIKPFPVSFFVAAAYDCNPNHSGYDKPATDGAYIEGTKDKLRTMFRTARIEGHDALVLSAFGCGAFANDPVVMARIFKDLLNEDEFKGAFKKISFGIIDKNGSGNLSVFKAAF